MIDWRDMVRIVPTRFTTRYNQIFLTSVNRIIRRFERFAIMLLTATIILACNSSVSNQNDSHEVGAVSTDCQVVQHMMGESCIPNNPQRVVTAVHHFLGHMLAVNVKPVGSNVRYLNQADGDYLSTQTYMGSETQGIKLLGIETQINIEKILALKPDLILAAEDSESLYPKLSQIAPVIVFSFEDIVTNWKGSFSYIAKLLGKEDKLQQALNKYNQRIENLRTSLGNRYENQTISLAGSNGSNMYVFSKNSFPGSILSDLGLERPEAQRTDTPYGAIYNLSEESLNQFADGDVLFFLAFTKDGEDAFRELRQRPLWQQLKAVQKNQVYFVNGYTWTGSNLFSADAIIDDLYKYLVK